MKVITCQKVIESRRVTLNDDICEILGVQKGDFVQFIETDGKLFIQKVKATA